MSEVLSPEEVDALLKGVSTGDVDTNAGFGVAAADVRELDLTNPDWVNRHQPPPLEFVNQLLTRHLQSSIRPMLKNEAAVSADPAAMTSYADYVVALERPTSINLINVPQLNSHVLFVLNAELVLNYVDFYYGGDGVHESHETLTRDFTVTEMGVASGLRRLTANYLADAWATVTPLDFEELGTESNPEFANYFSSTEVMVVSRFNISLGESSLGWLDIVIPRSALEPFRRALEASSQGDQKQQQGRWAAAFEEQVQKTEIELSSTLSTTSVNLGELVRLRIGDILPFELPPTVELSAGSIPLFRGTFGVSNGHNAIRILERLE